MRCMYCNQEYNDDIGFKLIDKTKTQFYCPNCSSILEQNHKLVLENDEALVCEITSKNGAVKFVSGNESYTLDSIIMHRLLNYHLNPNEVLRLRELKEGFHYMIRHDFYSEDGIALQPMDI